MPPRFVATDGGVTGETGDLPFDTGATGTMTRRERYRVLLDDFLIAPFRIMWADWRARVGGLIILLYVLMGSVGLWIVSEPEVAEGPRYVRPFDSAHTFDFFGLPLWTHPLGTDNLGRDLLSQTVYATQPMLEMIVAGALFTTLMATLVGTLSGYKGGRVDRLMMTFNDILMTIPGLPLIIVIAVFLQPRSPWVVGLILTINAWAGLARAIRSQVLTLREEAFVEASRLMGISTSRILSKDIIPGLMPYILVNFVNTARAVIFASVALYFLGILPSTGQGNWGVMMNRAYNTGGALHSLETAHWLLVPMAAIVILSFGLILFAQGTDRVFNPRVRARHAGDHETEGDDEERGAEMAAHIRG